MRHGFEGIPQIVGVGVGILIPGEVVANAVAKRGGAQVLGRDDIGSLEHGKCADFAIWRTDGLEFGGADDPVAALVLTAPQRADRLYVGGEAVVREGQLVRADEHEIAAEHRLQAQRFAA